MTTRPAPTFACLACFVFLAAWDWDFRSWPWSPSSDRIDANRAEAQKKQADAQRQDADAKRKQAEADKLLAQAQKEKAVQDAQVAQKRATEARKQATQARLAADEAAHVAEQAERTKTLLQAGSLVVVLAALAVSIYFYVKRVTVKNEIVEHVVKNEIRQEVVVRSPAHSVSHDAYAIDGLNVIRSFNRYQPPSLLVLLTLLLALRAREWTFKCFFDASTYHVFFDAKLTEQARLYTALCREFPNSFIEVPSGNQADPYILDYAHSHGTPIISNDLYRDFAATYSWVEQDRERRISGVCHADMVQILPLGIQAPLLTDLSAAVTSLRESLSTHDTKSA